jgi:hypothetical protein
MVQPLLSGRRPCVRWQPAFGALEVSLQNECNRQFVSVEGIPKVGKRRRQQLDFVEQLVKPEPGAPPGPVEQWRGTDMHDDVS